MTFPTVNCDAAKLAITKAIADRMVHHNFKTLSTMGITYASAKDLQRGHVPSMTMEKMITALRLLGGKVTITLDGVELPAGE